MLSRLQVRRFEISSHPVDVYFYLTPRGVEVEDVVVYGTRLRRSKVLKRVNRKKFMAKYGSRIALLIKEL